MSATTPSGEHFDDRPPSEQTPLLSSQHEDEPTARSALLDSLTTSKDASKRRWPSLLALLFLTTLVLLALVLGFLAPSTISAYTQQAATFDPEHLAITGFTSSGVRARVQGHFYLDATKVDGKVTRDLGRFFTSIARKAESGDSEVEVRLPAYGYLLLGIARVPGLEVDVRNGVPTWVDIEADLEAGDVDGIKVVAKDFLDGKLGKQIVVVGNARVPVKSGIFSLGSQSLEKELVIGNDKLPKMPAYKIQRLNFRDLHHGDENGNHGLAADVSLALTNPYPIALQVPSLDFHILVPACNSTEPSVILANATTAALQIEPHAPIHANITGLVSALPASLKDSCPDTHTSPLDTLLDRYMHGEPNTLYVRGAASPSTPDWLSSIISSLTVPVPLPGKEIGHLIKEFGLEETHFALPSPFADPDDADSNPRISAKVRAIVALPTEMNLELDVSRVRADADVFYKKRKLGILDLHRWQKANSTRLPPEPVSKAGPTLLVESAIKDAPLRITDEDVFADVIQDLIFGGKKVVMQIKAAVDVEVVTRALGAIVVRGVEAEGEVVVKPLGPPISPAPGNGDTPPHLGEAFKPKIHDLRILDTSPTSLTLSAFVNLTNPTPYTASVPYIDVHIYSNTTLIAHATARDLEVGAGANGNLLVKAVYDPFTLNEGSDEARGQGRELLSQYISGWNTSLTLKLHEGSFPGSPALGRALGRFNVSIPTPRLGSPPKQQPQPGDDDDPSDEDPATGGRPHFIEDATMHLLTSSATFTLLSPLRHETLYVTSINATAFYKGDDVGQIEYDLPFAVPPVDAEGKGTVSPRLPVDWSLGSVGFQAVRGALGGRLKLSAEAVVGVRVGRWEEEVWFRGKGIGASVRL